MHTGREAVEAPPWAEAKLIVAAGDERYEPQIEILRGECGLCWGARALGWLLVEPSLRRMVRGPFMWGRKESVAPELQAFLDRYKT